jgi:hypothetical protein
MLFLAALVVSVVRSGVHCSVQGLSSAGRNDCNVVGEVSCVR